jgi:Cysteine-rich CWC
MDAPQPRARTGDSAMTCQRCGEEFPCARDQPGGCWCAAENYRLPVPLPPQAGSFDDCLCPSCLRAVAGLLAARR